ncbi:MAG: exopolysaccharide biosynthesis polyprenyl glycosylphosphotransferase, partial [Atribacterota bacterium]|nr:exopolysaccharide biosynthesis polyprenyl glycosylphosphotransferase [Atribacterota bacterium]
YKERKHHPAELFLKRSFDFVVSLFLLILLSPLFLIIAILIKIDSPGPVFYTQKRVGIKGNFFNLYKFRSMIEGAEELKAALLEKNEIKDGIIFKIKNDPRITKLGIFIRKNSLDELPQLVNVLKGNMSLVGPRPAMPEEVGKYNHFQMDRLSIRPGITGLSQIKGRSDLTFRKWVKWDLWYINNWSFMLDLKILWRTIPVVFKRKGAY